MWMNTFKGTKCYNIVFVYIWYTYQNIAIAAAFILDTFQTFIFLYVKIGRTSWTYTF